MKMCPRPPSGSVAAIELAFSQIQFFFLGGGGGGGGGGEVGGGGGVGGG